MTNNTAHTYITINKYQYFQYKLQNGVYIMTSECIWLRIRCNRSTFHFIASLVITAKLWPLVNHKVFSSNSVCHVTAWCNRSLHLATGLTDSRTLGLSQEMRLWRELCIFHFENDQIFNVLKRGEDLSTIDWQELYKRLVKYGGVLYNCSFVQL